MNKTLEEYELKFELAKVIFPLVSQGKVDITFNYYNDLVIKTETMTITIAANNANKEYKNV